MSEPLKSVKWLYPKFFIEFWIEVFLAGFQFVLFRVSGTTQVLNSVFLTEHDGQKIFLASTFNSLES